MQPYSWPKFQKMLGFVAARKPGLAVIASHSKMLCGAITKSSDSSVASAAHKRNFSDASMPIEHLESAWEMLAHKYQVSGMTVIDREELLNFLGTLPYQKAYYTQLMHIREALGIDRGEKTKMSVHMGDRPVERFWPTSHFFLSLFQSMFSELLPEKKILLLGVVDPLTGTAQCTALEYHGAQLKGFMNPDWAGLDEQDMAVDLKGDSKQESARDYFRADVLRRYVLWCENRYQLPTYAVYATERVWNECRGLQMKSGRRAAWKYFLSSKSQRETELELLVEPEPWPLKASFYWNSKV